MSELPIVASTGCLSTPNFTGLNGSMRPRPQSGFRCIQASSSRSRSRARRVPGTMAKRYNI
jgi:hypothetical protein